MAKIKHTPVLKSPDPKPLTIEDLRRLRLKSRAVAANIRRLCRPKEPDTSTTDLDAWASPSALNTDTPVTCSNCGHCSTMRNGSTMSNTSAASMLQPPPPQVNMETDQQRLAGRIFTDAVTTPQWPPSANVTFDPADVRRMSQSVPPNSVHPATPMVEMPKRALPPREVTEETIEDAYIAFILYCNPTIPTPKEPTDLGRTFRTPPKSDGKAFSTFRLFELIRQLESKEIKSWSQLALSLGVDPPDRNQSSQKVQQYAVRLKVSRCLLAGSYAPVWVEADMFIDISAGCTRCTSMPSSPTAAASHTRTTPRSRRARTRRWTIGTVCHARKI